MKRASLPMLIIAFSLLFLTIASPLVNATAVNAKTTSSSSIDVQVDHVVEPRDGGLVIINDTVKLSTKPGEDAEPLQNFLIGFPFRYRFNLDYCFAYETSNPNVRLDVEPDVGLGMIGFYGVKVIFREPINISDGGSYNFTTVFVLSNLMSSRIVTMLNPKTGENESVTESDLDFPMYPSLTQEASKCNVTVIFPYPAYTPPANMSHDFNEIDYGSGIFNYVPESPLQAFADESGRLTALGWPGVFLDIDVNEIKRDIRLDEFGRILVSDLYFITNNKECVAGHELQTINITLPQGAYDVSARDESGELPVPPVLKGRNATIRLRTPLNKDESGKFTVSYSLPWKNYVNQYNWRDFNLACPFFENFNWTIRKLAVSVTLPEGADFQSSSINPNSVQKSVFQETVTYAFYNVTSFHDLDFDLTYGYLVFWASFRPTLWIGALVMIVCVIAFLWRAPKPPVPVIPVPPEALRSFVSAYEEKTRILVELESMEWQLRKGRIPRRRYKVRKRTLEGRLSTLARDLTDLREKIRTVGPRHADIMRQVEVAETILEGVETDIRRVRARYRRGEISKAAYHKLLEEYDRRRERAKTTIDGVLLRLREEIR